MGAAHSLTMIIKCTICNYTQNSNHNRITPSVNLMSQIMEKNNSIEILLTELFKNSYVCVECNNLLHIDYDLHDYLSLDFEEQDISVELGKIQPLLHHNSKEFVLGGVIEFEICESGFKKYTALCRSLQGFWSRKEDVKKFANINEKKFVKIAIIIYLQN